MTPESVSLSYFGQTAFTFLLNYFHSFFLTFNLTKAPDDNPNVSHLACFHKCLHSSRFWCRMSQSLTFSPSSKSHHQTSSPQVSLHTCEPFGASHQQMVETEAAASGIAILTQNDLFFNVTLQINQF